MEFLQAVLVGLAVWAVTAGVRWAVAACGRRRPRRRPEPRIRFLAEEEDEDDRG